MEHDSGAFVFPAIVFGIWMGLSQSCDDRKAKVEISKTEQGCVEGGGDEVSLDTADLRYIADKVRNVPDGPLMCLVAADTIQLAAVEIDKLRAELADVRAMLETAEILDPLLKDPPI